MRDIKTLYQKFLAKQCSREEAETLLQYFREQPDSEQIIALIQSELERTEDLSYTKEDSEALARNKFRLKKAILGEADRPNKHRILRWLPYAAAAVLLIISINAITYFILKDRKAGQQLSSQYGGDALPGGNRAYLTLSDGRRMELDSSHAAIHSVDGKLLYADGAELMAGSIAAYATVVTPIGGEYEVILPDGTKAWLNAASSIKYPIRFTEKERSIEVQGEVYLEVASDKQKPFKVHTSGQQIEVLGTAFNIRSYGTDVLTTLVEGKIALTNQFSKERVTLKPGQQATVNEGKTVIANVEPNDYTAWKEGVILNREGTLLETCTELERWYGVKFIFPAGFKNNDFAFNNIDRNEMLSSVLAALENSYQVKFEIKGKEVFVR